ATERKTALSDVEELREKLRALPEFASLTDSDRGEIDASFTGIVETVANSKLIAVIRERVSGFRSSTYPALLGRVTAPPPAPPAQKGDEEAERQDFRDEASSPPPPVQPEYVAAGTLRV